MKKQAPGFMKSPLPTPEPSRYPCEMGITKIARAVRDMKVERKTQMMANAVYRGDMMADMNEKISDSRLR